MRQVSPLLILTLAVALSFSLAAISLLAQTNTDITGLELVNIRETRYVLDLRRNPNRLPSFRHDPVKVGEKKGGFEVTSVSSNQITFLKNGKSITLETGRSYPLNEYEARFVDKASGTNITLKSGGKFVYGNLNLELTKISDNYSTCYLKDLNSQVVYKMEKHYSQEITFTNLQQAVVFIATSLESTNFEGIANACLDDRRKPNNALLMSLQRTNQVKPLRQIYATNSFPTNSPSFKLGGHMKELGFTNIDFIQTNGVWKLQAIWQCR